MFVGHRADLTDTRMPPTAIIIHHPPVNSQIQLSPGGECVTIVVFMFEGRPERFRACIIPTDAGPAHGLAEPRFLAFIRHVPAGILSTPIGMKNGALDAVTPRPDGHVQTVNNQFSTHVIGRGPAQCPLGMLVPDRAQVDVALTAGQVRDVRRPDGIEPALIEPAVHQVRRRDRRPVRDCRAYLERSGTPHPRQVCVGAPSLGFCWCNEIRRT